MLKSFFLVLLSVFLFFHGFFPISESQKNKIKANPPTKINNVSLNVDETYTSQVDKVVVIVIDALRLDFINENYLPDLSEIVKTKGCVHEVKVESPTVTLPRIKALTTGNVPQFIDLVLNLASTEILHDSILHSAVESGKKILFFGDDTWLKLFPKFFTRFEGTTSFFVKDFYEVDNNVTRNVNLELSKSDWDIMILHYLGLDHIGHVLGPFSSLVPVKLKEMEDIVIKIYEHLQQLNEKYLILITGDHGMKDSGGHGGSTFQETNVPLVVIGGKCEPTKLSQIDIPVNLAILLGISIPSSSIGQIKSNLFSSLPLEKYLLSLRYNVEILLKKKNMCETEYEIASQFHSLFLKTNDSKYADRAVDLFRNCSKIISEHLLNNSTKQNVQSLTVSLALMFYLLVILFKSLDFYKIRNLLDVEAIFNVLIFVIILLQFLIPDNSFIYFLLLLVLINGVFLLIQLGKGLIKTNYFQCDCLLIIFTVIHPFTFFSSSYVEEEHQYWYFCLQLLLLHLISKFELKFAKLVAASVVFRFLRTINQTGDKWANSPDFSDFLLKNENYYYLQAFFIFGITTFGYYVIKLSKNNATKVLSIFATLLILFFKTTELKNVILGQIIWLFILINFTFNNLIVTWLLISALMLKSYNIILISYCVYVSQTLRNFVKNDYLFIIAHIWLSNALYFAQGHSNSFASVDVSVGYIGLSTYQPVLVILQVICHTYALPVLCHILLFSQTKIGYSKLWTVLFISKLFIYIVISIVTFSHRDHLFIWSVFAPKLFIETVHSLVLFSEVVLYYFYKTVLKIKFKLYLECFIIN